MNHVDPPQMARIADGDSSAGTPHRRRLTKWLVVIGAVMLVAGPVLYFELPHEVARWYAAAADENRLSGDYEAAIEHLTTAIAWNDQSAQLLVERARLKTRLDDWQGALEDCDRARQLTGGALLAAATRTECLHRLGRHAEATQQWRDLLAEENEGESDNVARAQLLNGLAYACAVGKLDLEEALAAADEAVRLSVNEAALLDPKGVYFAARAGIEIQVGKDSAALASYEQAGKSAAEALQRETLRYEALTGTGDSDGGLADEYAERVAALRPHLAGILTQRAELYDDLEKPNEAKRDRDQLDSLEQDGNLSVAVPLSWGAAMLALLNNAAILDTRGLIYYHQGDLEKALQDTDNAVKSAEWQFKAADWMAKVDRNFSVDLRRQEAARQERARSVAVIRYHRMLVLEKLGRTARAAEDRTRIEQLGFEPGEQLF